MAGLIAAVMGHTSGAINSCTTIATIDFYLPFRKWQASRTQLAAAAAVANVRSMPPGVEHSERRDPDADSSSATTDAQAVRFGRLIGILVIVVGVVCAELLTQHSKKPIFLYLLDAYGYFTPGIATMFLLGILWKRTTRAGALTAGVMTIPLSLALKWIFPSLAFQNRTGIVFWTCMLTCAAVSLCTVPRSAADLKGLIWTVDSLRLPADQRDRYRGVRSPFLWWAIITAIVLFFYVRFA
jgi:SSS family solute:Na+ symporter